MPRKKENDIDPKYADLSAFNRGVIIALCGLMARNKKGKVAVDRKAKAVTLSATMAGRPVVFAAMRSLGNLKSDVRLYGYLPDQTSLTKDLQRSVQSERGGLNGWFIKGLADPSETAQALFLHFKDIDARVKSYAKTNMVKPGEKPRRTWAAQGIPFSYFQ